MVRKGCERVRRRLWVRGHYKLWLRTALRLEARIGHRAATYEIREAVPASPFDAPEEVGRLIDRPASARIVAVIARVETPIRSQRQPKRIANAPRHKLQSAAVRPYAHDRGRRRQLPFDHLAGLALVAEWLECAGALPGDGQRDSRVLAIEILTREHHVARRDIVQFRVLWEPRKDCVILADNGGIGDRALREINPAITTDHRPIRVMITFARDTVDDWGDSPIHRHPAHTPWKSAFGDEDPAA